ncbi:hypothetical protein [Clostridium folliculivorans]|uniref:hypothetical protein n=1 Tax=Clostridium folliculivorans TaxID=2886038 RepID=UPI0021C2F282|nr:hypothetical protein [Clostridium folliculivorans]GKU28639.1 hypothetical protein CFB3_07450 [Clostridium folliculivorans]
MSSRFRKFIIFLGIVNLIFSALVFANLASPMERVYGIPSLVTFISSIGILKYKKWGVYLYFFSLTISLIIHISMRSDYINNLFLILNLLLIYPVRASWKSFSDVGTTK